MEKQKHSFKELLVLLLQKRMLVVLLLGFSSGLPIMVIYKTLKLWLRREGIDLSTIGFMSFLAVPYSWNFVWAFLLDRYTFFKSFGRRRGWLAITQIALALSFLALSFAQPQQSLTLIAIAGFLLCFFSATHDVAVDAYRNEILDESELGVGASFGVYGYRVAMWVASGFCIWIVDADTWNWTFNQMFRLLSFFALLGLLVTFWADEPENYSKKVSSLTQAVVHPFLDFFKRESAILILLFILLYKFGDAICGSMTSPFYADLGYSNKDIGAISSTVGFFSTMAGLFIGGGVIYRFGYKAGLWVGGILQALSTGAYAILAYVTTKMVFAGIVFFEDMSSGIGTAALVALMGKLTNKSFTASQYALFASLASFGRTFFSGFAGQLIEYMQAHTLLTVQHAGYAQFFVSGMLMAIPGLICLYVLGKRTEEVLK
ncbi:MAG TPA: MFS transporter [Oligoflexia bacterium]|nr:MFS transporter [Oligoflexia bacterium]HMR25314.1 MFS transporter [Oligoflexia bacterium]